MRKILFFYFLLSFALLQQANAQLLKGKIAIGGQVNFNNTTNKSTSIVGRSGTRSSNTITLTPNFSFFLSPKWSLGLGVGLTQATFTSSSDTTSSSGSGNTISIAPFVRHYIPASKSGSRFYFYAQLSFSLAFGNSSSTSTALVGTNSSSSTKNNSTDIGLSPGVLFFPSKRWALDFSIRGFRYVIASNETESTSGVTSSTVTVKSNDIDLGVNMFNPTLGILFFIK